MGIFWQLLPLLRAPRGAPTSPLLAPSIPGGLSHDPYSKKTSCLYLCSSLQAEKPRGQPGHAMTPQPLVFTPMVPQAGCALRCAAVRGLLVDGSTPEVQAAPPKSTHTARGQSPLGQSRCDPLSLPVPAGAVASLVLGPALLRFLAIVCTSVTKKKQHVPKGAMA